MFSHGLRNLAQSPALMRDLRQGVVSLKSSMTCSPSGPDWYMAYSQLASVFLESLISERPTVTPRMTRPALPLGMGAWPLGKVVGLSSAMTSLVSTSMPPRSMASAPPVLRGDVPVFCELGETAYLGVRSPMNWIASGESREARRVFLTSLSQRAPPMGQM